MWGDLLGGVLRAHRDWKMAVKLICCFCLVVWKYQNELFLNYLFPGQSFLICLSGLNCRPSEVSLAIMCWMVWHSSCLSQTVWISVPRFPSSTRTLWCLHCVPSDLGTLAVLRFSLKNHLCPYLKCGFHSSSPRYFDFVSLKSSPTITLKANTCNSEADVQNSLSFQR